MKKGKILLLVLLLAAGIILYFWEPWNALKEEPKLENAADIMEEARDAAGDIKNYTYKTEVSVGNQVNVDILNRVDRDDDRQMVDFTWQIPQMSGETLMYIQGDEVYVLSPVKKKWGRPEEDPTVGPFVEFFYRQLSLVDPVSNLINIDQQSGKVSVITQSEKENTAQKNTAHKNAGQEYVIEVIPEAGALSELTDAMPPQLKGAELKEIKQVFRISRESYLPVRYEVHARVSFFGLASMKFTVDSVPRDYNKTELNIPKELEQKMKGQ
ncbi:DUF6612 family protein [Phosphitispora fastidiosa]|uniref:DUF6612 family protein n=1 Tax=Phosphitispora fastidiosa TaxID=2837202 RepID=UPI001E557FE0|nr:DUF6612 family protein [Phosphitispora fastidiosa]MBU7008754.1 archaellin [Phosphitispora fastidiosa]